MKPERVAIEPGKTRQLTVVFDGSPQWWSTAKSMRLSIAPGVFDNDQPVSFSERISDIDKVIIEKFN